MALTIEVSSRSGVGITRASAINTVITRAVQAWPLPERVRRLSVPILTYQAVEWDDFEFLVCVRHDTIVGRSSQVAGRITEMSTSSAMRIRYVLVVNGP